MNKSRDYAEEIKNFVYEIYSFSCRKEEYSKEYIDYFLDVYGYYKEGTPQSQSFELAFEDTKNIIGDDYRKLESVLTLS